VLEELGIAGASASQVSQLCAGLDEKVRNSAKVRWARSGTCGWTRCEKVRVDDRAESIAVATGVSLEGRREVLGLDVIPVESEEGWAQFFKSLMERGLRA